jgi:hypothetical protein
MTLLRPGAALALAILLFTPSAPALAHHSVAGTFDVSKEVVVTGKIVKIEWTNPHVFVYVEATDQSGKATTWAFESLPIHMFHQAGVTKEMLLGGRSTTGQTVTVKALPAHVTPNGGLITRISYPDGHFYQLYVSPQPGKPAPEGRDQ